MTLHGMTPENNQIENGAATTGRAPRDMPRDTPRDVTADGPAFFIDRRGAWFHGGVLIARAELVRLFASILRRLDDGSYWIYNPAEKAQVEVEDLPYIISEAALEGDTWFFTTTLGERVPLDAAHKLVVENNRPQIIIRAGCAARIPTHIFYRLVEAGQVDAENGLISLCSAGQNWQLGEIAEEGTRL